LVLVLGLVVILDSLLDWVLMLGLVVVLALALVRVVALVVVVAAVRARVKEVLQDRGLRLLLFPSLFA